MTAVLLRMKGDSLHQGNLPPMNGRTCQGAALRLSWRSVSGGIVHIKETRPNGECQVILIEEVP